MPRTLPWLPQAKDTDPQRSSSSPAPKRKCATTLPSALDAVDGDLNTTSVGAPTSERRTKARKLGHSPSTSPPPAPPDVEYMREGFTQDDIWMMVEDEFYSTAQLYTQHIHHAEYVRLKKLAKARGQSTLRALDRPTDGQTAQSMATKLRLEAEEKARRAKAGVNAMGGGREDSEDEDEYMLDPQLAGLMTASQRSAQDLTGVAKARANTRAAAGFERSPQKVQTKSGSSKKNAVKQKQPATVESSGDEDDDDDDGDLDGKPVARPPEVKGRPALVEQPRNNFFKRFTDGPAHDSNVTNKTIKTDATRPSKRPKHEALSITSSSKVASACPAKSPKVAGAEDEDDFAASISAKSQATMDFLAKRRAAKAAKEKKGHASHQVQSSRSTVEVPTFIL